MAALGSLLRASTHGAAVWPSYIWEVTLGRSSSDSIVITCKIFQFPRIELILASMNLYLLSLLWLPVCLWGLA